MRHRASHSHSRLLRIMGSPRAVKRLRWAGEGNVFRQLDPFTAPSGLLIGRPARAPANQRLVDAVYKQTAVGSRHSSRGAQSQSVSHTRCVTSARLAAPLAVLRLTCRPSHKLSPALSQLSQALTHTCTMVSVRPLVSALCAVLLLLCLTAHATGFILSVSTGCELQTRAANPATPASLPRRHPAQWPRRRSDRSGVAYEHMW